MKTTKQQSVEGLVKLMSLAAQQGDEVALKIMDEVQTILTTEWEDLPEKLREQMAYVTANMMFDPLPDNKEDNAEEG